MNKIPYIVLVLAALSGCCKKDADPVPPITYQPLADEEIVTLPVIFHIIHRGEPIRTGDNLPDSLFNKHLQRLNLTFRNQQTGSASVDTKIQFRLATLDREGNPLRSPGVDRILYDNYSQVLPKTGGFMKDSQWDTRKYVNIWVLDTDPSIGNWAYYPVLYKDHEVCGLPSTNSKSQNIEFEYADGLVFSNERLKGRDMSHLFAHEMGHYLGLPHVFNDSSCVGPTCFNDTYHYNRSTYNATRTDTLRFYRSTCAGTLSKGDNYMDYYYSLRFRFTNEQKARMRYVLSFGINRREARFSAQRSLTPPTIAPIDGNPLVIDNF